MSEKLNRGTGGGGSGSGDSSGGGGWRGFVLPDWLSSLRPLADAVKRYGVQGAIGFFVLEWFVGGFIDFLADAVSLVLESFALVAETPIMLATSLAKALGIAGDALLMPWRIVTDLLVGLASAAGPFGPLVFALGLWLAVELVVRTYKYIFSVINPA